MKNKTPPNDDPGRMMIIPREAFFTLIKDDLERLREIDQLEDSGVTITNDSISGMWIWEFLIESFGVPDDMSTDEIDSLINEYVDLEPDGPQINAFLLKLEAKINQVKKKHSKKLLG